MNKKFHKSIYQWTIVALMICAVFGILYIWDFLQGATPIWFHGVVVDQNGTRIPDVKVVYEISRYRRDQIPFIPWRSGDTYQDQNTTRTNSDGAFTIISGMGSGLRIGAFEKDAFSKKDYRLVRSSYDCQIEVPSYTYTYSWFYSGLANPRYHPDWSQPAKFTIWEMGLPDRLIRGKRCWKISPRDDQPMAVDLLGLNQVDSHEVRPMTGKQLEKARANPASQPFMHDLRMTLSSRDSEDKQKIRWNFKIEAVDGGLQETSDKILYTAPESGYQNTLEYDSDHPGSVPSHRYYTDLAWKDFYKTIYFKTRGGAICGNMLLVIYPDTRSNFRQTEIWLIYTINPAGSRNLETCPGKTIDLRDWIERRANGWD